PRCTLKAHVNRTYRSLRRNWTSIPREVKRSTPRTVTGSRMDPFDLSCGTSASRSTQSGSTGAAITASYWLVPAGPSSGQQTRRNMGLSWQQGPLSPGAIGRFLVPEPLPKRLLYAEPLRRRMRVCFGGSWIVDSEDVVLLFEPGHYPM